MKLVLGVKKLGEKKNKVANPLQKCKSMLAHLNMIEIPNRFVCCNNCSFLRFIIVSLI